MIHCGHVSGGHKCNLVAGHTGDHYHAGVGWPNTDSLTDKIVQLASSQLPDNQRLQVLIHLTAQLSKVVESSKAIEKEKG